MVQARPTSSSLGWILNIHRDKTLFPTKGIAVPFVVITGLPPKWIWGVLPRVRKSSWVTGNRPGPQPGQTLGPQPVGWQGLYNDKQWGTISPCPYRLLFTSRASQGPPHPPLPLTYITPILASAVSCISLALSLIFKYLIKFRLWQAFAYCLHFCGLASDTVQKWVRKNRRSLSSPKRTFRVTRV